jgi:hypothetical protein
MEQVCPAATVEPQVVVKEKSVAFAPERVGASEFRGAVPEFVRVIVCAPEATPWTVLPKTRALGERVALGEVPVPVRVTDSGGMPDNVAVSAEV